MTETAVLGPRSDSGLPLSAKTPTITYTRVLSPTPPAVDNALLSELFTENILAKVYRTAAKFIPSGVGQEQVPAFTPEGFPEYVPQDGPNAGLYTFREPRFWTCGFFPGTLWNMAERLVKFPSSTDISESHGLDLIKENVVNLAKQWAEPLHEMANRTDTHDIGFIVMPALRRSWEITGDRRSLDSIFTAAHSLATRYVPSARAIRSWDQRIQGNLQITCQKENLILIIDSMCNMDLLYYAASQAPEASRLADIATAHATTLMRTHLRHENSLVKPEGAYKGPWYSSFHVANLDPRTGELKRNFTAQGYADESTWTRGQAWGILGYAQTYMWTKDVKFLDAACGLAEYFLYRLDTSPECVEVGLGNGTKKHRPGRLVPLWDFDAPIEDVSNPTRDSSAGAIAANGILILSEVFSGLGDEGLAVRYRTAALDIVQDLLDVALAPEKARLITGEHGRVRVDDLAEGETFEALMRNGTANNNQYAPRRYANHGLVYGDYYLVEFGNMLLRMGRL